MSYRLQSGKVRASRFRASRTTAVEIAQHVIESNVFEGGDSHIFTGQNTSYERFTETGKC